MSNNSALSVRFWGVRGSTPTPMADHLGYGGNTTCLEIRGAHGECIVFDAGSGIRELGLDMARDERNQQVDLFLTHFHWDHIQGIPFFAPLLLPDHVVTFHSFPTDDEIQARLKRQMSDPYFTLDFQSVGATRQFCAVEKVFRKGSLSVTAFPLHHPQGASGYRIDCEDKSIVIATDFEHGDAALDKTLRTYCEGADVLIFDAQYTPEEYVKRRGWGHSTYTEAACVARDARVKQLVLFHHDPTHNDAAVAEIVRKATPLFENTVAATENQVIAT